LRHIPNPTTFDNLFNSWTYAIIGTETYNIYPHGPALESGAVLFTGDGTGKVYLIDNLGNGIEKRWIISPTAFNEYDFNWGQIKTYPATIVNGIPTGSNING